MIHEPLKDCRGSFQAQGHASEFVCLPPNRKGRKLPGSGRHPDAEKRVLQINARKPAFTLGAISDVLEARQVPVEIFRYFIGGGTIDAHPDTPVLFRHQGEVVRECGGFDWFDDFICQPGVHLLLALLLLYWREHALASTRPSGA